VLTIIFGKVFEKAGDGIAQGILTRIRRLEFRQFAYEHISPLRKLRDRKQERRIAEWKTTLKAMGPNLRKYEAKFQAIGEDMRRRIDRFNEFEIPE
jgi:hypothetical protein